MFTSRNTLTAGLVLLALTSACSRDAADGITGPANGTARAVPPPATAAPPTAVPPGRTSAATGSSGGNGEFLGWDLALAPFSYRDVNGRLFEVVFAVDGSGQIAFQQHSRDGVPFATVSGDASVSDVMVSLLSNGQVGYEQLVTPGAPLGARFSEEQAGPPPVRHRPPERAMAYIPCETEWSTYAAASTGMIAAYVAYRARPGVSTASLLSAAVGAFVRSWLALYSCMEDYYALHH